MSLHSCSDVCALPFFSTFFSKSDEVPVLQTIETLLSKNVFLNKEVS
jgi:hypothetical protein